MMDDFNMNYIVIQYCFPYRGERGSVIFSTKPKILVCDLTLVEDQQKDCNQHHLFALFVSLIMLIY